MNLQERSYSTKIIRPKPLVYSEDDGSLIVIANAWGQQEHAQGVIDEVVKYVNAAKSDVEATSPFEFLTCLSDEVNYLRTGILIANDFLYRGENRTQYFSGVEILAIFKRGSQIAWAQVGNPSLYIQRQGRSLQPLSVSHDLASEINLQNEILPPLPGQMIGLESTCNIQCGHTLTKEGDQLVLLSSTVASKALWAKDVYPQNLTDMTKMMIQGGHEIPFWLGIVNL
jgi:hypothetical protein